MASIPSNPTFKPRQDTKSTKAKRALRSLAIAIAIPLSINLTIIFLFGSGRKYYSITKPFWFPTLWFIHLASLGSSFLMGLAAWLVWADGGFHAQSDALPLYIAQVSLSIVWDPLVLVFGSAWLGFVFCVIHFGTLILCYLRFKKVNPFAKDLVKLCLAWVAYLAIVSFKLMYL